MQLYADTPAGHTVSQASLGRSYPFSSSTPSVWIWLFFCPDVLVLPPSPWDLFFCYLLFSISSRVEADLMHVYWAFFHVPGTVLGTRDRKATWLLALKGFCSQESWNLEGKHQDRGSCRVLWKPQGVAGRSGGRLNQTFQE